MLIPTFSVRRVIVIAAIAFLAVGGFRLVMSNSGLTGAAPKPTLESAKLNGYIDAYNKLVGNYGVDFEYKLYSDQRVSSLPAGTTRHVNVSVGWMDQAMNTLKTTRALPGESKDLDTSADHVIAALEQLFTRINGLSDYYASRGDLQDGLARGKQEDPLLIADFKTAIAATSDFNHVIEAQITVRDELEIAKMKERGDIIGYDESIAMQKSKALIKLFDSVDDLRDKALLAQSDALIAQIEPVLADERSETAKAGKPRYTFQGAYGSPVENLTKMIGHYREFRQNNDASSVNEMVKDYNNAVSALNNRR